ncbi:MAG: CTP synthase [Actinobacteria bacterium HGW-Actinobacteria-9]|jgi:CTP synthase|nr:MAG: CTP synthase [Actinobacteria bacterium HGW-Actinobacteria-9]
MTKYIFVTGGVVSSLGKGITAASLGRLLKSRGLKVRIQKLDPYLNVDPGTMSPFQHGEVFVTDDGAETDLDLGHYERFIDESLTRDCNVTAGKIYSSIITRERRGDFLGGTVQVIPHVTNEIKDRITRLAEEVNPDVVIVEVGGTVGDIESLPFIESIRQLKKDAGAGNVCYIHVTLVPWIAASSELKTKPTQHSVKELRSIGIQPDFIVCRSDRPIDESIRRKIGLFCDVDAEAVVSAMDASSIYAVPRALAEQRLDEMVIERLGLECGQPDMADWYSFVDHSASLADEVQIALVGKYVQLPDAYLSVIEALDHAGIYHDHKVRVHWVDAESLTPDEVESALEAFDGILVPGGFGIRGIEGKIRAAKYARENKVPYFGICLGMQVAVAEFARHVAGFDAANSTEFDPVTQHPVIDLMRDQEDVTDMGGTMRLGTYPCKVVPDTRGHAAYGEELIYERHRHRYELNNSYRDQLADAGLVISGVSPDGRLVEMVELPDHPWFLGNQGHPEFKSRPTRPAPLFRDFVGAAVDYHKAR